MRKILLPLLALFAAAQTTARTVPDWLERAVIYHIYPSTFMDSDGDGIGDLEGIRSKLGYIRATGFNTIWMSPASSRTAATTSPTSTASTRVSGPTPSWCG